MQDDNELIVPVDFKPSGHNFKNHDGHKFSATKICLLVLLIGFAGAAWFILSAKSVFIEVNPPHAELSINTPLAIKIGSRYLVRQGELPLQAKAEGYYELDSTLTVTDQQAQSFSIDLLRLPGFLTVTNGLESGATITIDGILQGLAPLSKIELSAGEHILNISKDRFQPLETIVDIEGRSTEQSLNIDLLPAWGNLSLDSFPQGATVSVDGIEQGTTPFTYEPLAGQHLIRVKLTAHKAWTEEIEIEARQDLSLPLISLVPADGLVLLQSTPTNAGVTVDGQYQGQTPLEISVSPDISHEVNFFLNGYEDSSQVIRTQADQESSVIVDLKPRLSQVTINTQPNNAQLFVNGELKGEANQTIELLAASQTIEVKLEGYVSFQTNFTSRPGLEQKLDIVLKSLEQERIDSILPLITTVNQQTLKLLYPSNFVMGASRREAGRQANEVLRTVNLTQAFYLSTTEVTNAQFAAYDPEHSSGIVQRQSLNNSKQPVVQVTWQQAALYCNWLSQQESLPLFYQVESGQITGFDSSSDGYRLPTEAEWAWAARVDDSAEKELKFPWGAQLPPPENHGNYADITAAPILGRILSDYNDSFLATAPVASFKPNRNGFYDMGGNVAEWTHDYYGTTGLLSGNQNINPYGPSSGNYHVVRGSSWAHGSITELRLSYRDYSDEARDDLGFRVARTLSIE